MKKTPRTVVLDILLILVGGLCFALSVNLFIVPYKIVTGGLTGIAILIHELFPSLGIGVMVLVMNIPLFIAGAKACGRWFLVYSLIGTFTASFMMEWTAGIPPVETEPLMAALAGGLMMGFGLGLVFTRGGSTGGTDVIARLLRLRFPGFKMGQLVLILDVVVVVASVVVYKNINSGLYSILAIFLSTQVIDLLLYGVDAGRVMYIISKDNERIAKEIQTALHRGVTFLSGQGAYTGTEQKIILCAIRRLQLPQVKAIVKSIDPNAFIILLKAHEVLGLGFDE